MCSWVVSGEGGGDPLPGSQGLGQVRIFILWVTWLLPLGAAELARGVSGTLFQGNSLSCMISLWTLSPLGVEYCLLLPVQLHSECWLLRETTAFLPCAVHKEGGW